MSGESIFAIVLAAGSSTRFGRTKQLELYEGTPLAAHALRQAESVFGVRTLLVVGNEWKAVVDTCEPLAGFFVINEKYGEGIASSIACGVRAVADGADAILLTMADLPLVTAEHLSALAQGFRESPGSIVASAFDDTVGPPVIFPKSDFAALLALKGDHGAKPVIDANRDRVLSIACEEAAFDIDRPEDLAGIY
ncbi:MAG: nucleotidyltransferase family protein [Woeseiaceae bacterium]|nr:nucleotidyltransferase family protein [Woeseiaceae bacterium]